MRLEALALALPEFADHPNRVDFEGVLTMVDEPSNRPPSGARGHRVIFARMAAMAALPSLIGMAVDFSPEWDGHDARRKCGIITEAELEGKRLVVSGYLFGKDFPEVRQQMLRTAPGTMGMSYEISDAHVADMSAEIWTLTRATFTGAAILLREKAAYRNTSFELKNQSCRGAPLHARARTTRTATGLQREKAREKRWN
ncbi:hypothetical protein [Silvibacterium dinghuense]|uniref:hypothetical protein n=1 Tax=Silvibacterium dinghuense TaxID=1560006 RepID=UPI00166B2B55|nr:hypothetical protein [Silvibacterium dinghuense]GGH01705.1 hypothetical protein GCM10011586_16720 [Silvibacterium dinghuense]